MLSVSVVVPSFQGKQRLAKLLRAFEQQQTECEWEVVVVLDGSTDGSAEFLANYNGPVNLTVVPREENLGRSATLNEGFALAKNQVLVRCDDDLEPAPNYIDAFSKLLTEIPNAGVIGLYRNNYPKTAYSRAYGEIVDRRFAKEAYADAPDDRWHYWAGNCAVTRETFDLVGGYDETFRQYGWEDVDWGYRLASLGHPIILSPALETTHNVAATTTAGRCERARWSGFASVKFYEKHQIQVPKSQTNLWNTLVASATPFAGRGLGKLVDFVLPILPAKVALRLVDLSVQAAFKRGVADAQN
jgi:GT2 family glycosyltransferase